mgnify:CR=1 FL=1
MNNKVLLRVENLKKWFPLRRSIKEIILREPVKYVRAVDGISFHINQAEIFGLAGESGSGKTTTGKLLLRLYEPDGGKILFDGKDLLQVPRKEFKPYRKKMQIIYQDPYGSLNPRMKVKDIVMEPLNYLEPDLGYDEKLERVIKTLEEVKLIPIEDFIEKFPHQLSGGQRQRVAIARAIVVKPKFIVADEPVSMLDVSVRAGILNLLMDLRKDLNVSFLYITHDLATAGYVTDRLAIMYLGKIVEMGATDKILTEPMHPYTQALISAVPEPDPERKIAAIIKGEIPSPINIPKGCRFKTRCPFADKCPYKDKEPPLIEVERGRWVACWLYA